MDAPCTELSLSPPEDWEWDEQGDDPYNCRCFPCRRTRIRYHYGHDGTWEWMLPEHQPPAPCDPARGEFNREAVLRVDDIYEWKVNMTVLKARSEVFDKMFQDGGEDGEKPVLHLEDDVPEMVVRMRLWCTTGSYPASSSIPLSIRCRNTLTVNQLLSAGLLDPSSPPLQSPEPRLISPIHVDMHALAVRYAIPDLQTYSQSQLREALAKQGVDAFFMCAETLSSTSTLLPESTTEAVENELITYAGWNFQFLGGQSGMRFVLKSPELAGSILREIVPWKHDKEVALIMEEWDRVLAAVVGCQDQDWEGEARMESVVAEADAIRKETMKPWNWQRADADFSGLETRIGSYSYVENLWNESQHKEVWILVTDAEEQLCSNGEEIPEQVSV